MMSRLLESPLLISQTNVEVSEEADFSKLLQLEEDYVQKICNDIIDLKPDLVFTEKGVSGNVFIFFGMTPVSLPCLFGEFECLVNLSV